MKDNRGITLVELLVSLAIFGIVAAALAGITSMVLKFYSSEKTDAGMQYEAQTALNKVMDLVMQTNGIAFYNVENGADVETMALFLGEFTFNGSTYVFDGEVIYGDYSDGVNALYVGPYRNADTGQITVFNAMEALVIDFFSRDEDFKKGCLLAESVKTMQVLPYEECVSGGDTSSGDAEFFNPFSVYIEIVLEARTQKGIETKQVTDRVMLRNTLDVVYNGDCKYEKSKDK